MKQASRHWYLQKMGIPVWLPNAATAEAAETPAAADQEQAAEQSPGQTVGQSVLTEAAQSQRTLAQPASARPIDETLVNQAPPEQAVWVVAVGVANEQKPAAEQLLEKVLQAVDIPQSACRLLWAVPNQNPPASVKHLLCFGIQAPPNVSAAVVNLPSLSQMLSDTAAKRQAWERLQAAMPFEW